MKPKVKPPHNPRPQSGSFSVGDVLGLYRQGFTKDEISSIDVGNFQDLEFQKTLSKYPPLDEHNFPVHDIDLMTNPENVLLGDKLEEIPKKKLKLEIASEPPLNHPTPEKTLKIHDKDPVADLNSELLDDLSAEIPQKNQEVPKVYPIYDTLTLKDKQDLANLGFTENEINLLDPIKFQVVKAYMEFKLDETNLSDLTKLLRKLWIQVMSQ